MTVKDKVLAFVAAFGFMLEPRDDRLTNREIRRAEARQGRRP